GELGRYRPIIRENPYATSGIADCSDTSAAGLGAAMAVFRQLGLWPVRRPGPGAPDRADPDPGRAIVAAHHPLRTSPAAFRARRMKLSRPAAAAATGLAASTASIFGRTETCGAGAACRAGAGARPQKRAMRRAEEMPASSTKGAGVPTSLESI